jgi:hypothetical protein
MTADRPTEPIRSDPATVKRLLADLRRREERQPDTSSPVPGSKRAAGQGYGK